MKTIGLEDSKDEDYCCAKHRRMLEALQKEAGVHDEKHAVASFIEESIIPNPEAWTKVEDLYAAYERSGRLKLTYVQFSRVFSSLLNLPTKQMSIKGVKRRGYFGIELRGEE